MAGISKHFVNKKDIDQRLRKSVPASFFSSQRTLFFQPKITVGTPSDVYEKEADAVANQVMRMPDPQIQRQEEAEESVQRQPMEEEEEAFQRKPLAGNITPFFQRKEAGGGEVGHQTAASLQLTKGGGRSLREDTRSWMESRFGADFSGVKVHTDSNAVQLSRELNAQAFTHGSDIYFNQGKFAPGTSVGKRLLAHELTHVVQQGNGGTALSATRNTVDIRNAYTSRIQRKNGNEVAESIPEGGTEVNKGRKVEVSAPEAVTVANEFKHNFRPEPFGPLWIYFSIGTKTGVTAGGKNSKITVSNVVETGDYGGPKVGRKVAWESDLNGWRFKVEQQTGKGKGPKISLPLVGGKTWSFDLGVAWDGKKPLSFKGTFKPSTDIVFGKHIVAANTEVTVEIGIGPNKKKIARATIMHLAGGMLVPVRAGAAAAAGNAGKAAAAGVFGKTLGRLSGMAKFRHILKTQLVVLATDIGVRLLWESTFGQWLHALETGKDMNNALKAAQTNFDTYMKAFGSRVLGHYNTFPGNAAKEGMAFADKILQSLNVDWNQLDDNEKKKARSEIRKSLEPILFVYEIENWLKFKNAAMEKFKSKHWFQAFAHKYGLPFDFDVDKLERMFEYYGPYSTKGTKREKPQYLPTEAYFE